ncbi:hypothetical protein JTB14_004443 [Gonioctena quinquepunctata]|nr:hypothetical protein JTB14_004443 [Gonioctena quinquepunctata]
MLLTNTVEMKCSETKNGHISVNCPENVTEPIANTPQDNPVEDSASQTPEIPLTVTEPINIFNQDKSVEDVTPQGQETPFLTYTISQKRPHSEISPPIQNSAKELEPSTISSSQVKKKSKSQIHNQSFESLVAPAKKLFDDNPADFPLDYSQIVSFLEDSFGTPDPLSVARRSSHAPRYTY